MRDLTRAYLRESRIPFTKGVLVTGTIVGQPAEVANLSVGDIIIRVDDKPVTSVEELQSAVAKWQNPRRRWWVWMSCVTAGNSPWLLKPPGSDSGKQTGAKRSKRRPARGPLS